MSQDERPEDEEGQDELYAAFEALGGQLTWDELDRLLRSGRCQVAAAMSISTGAVRSHLARGISSLPRPPG